MFVITGGGSGLGKALAVSLANRGKSVLIVGRRKALLHETATLSPLIQYLCADVSNEEGRTLLQQHIAHIPQIKALVNNAGTLKPLVPLREMQSIDWHNTLNTNVDAALFLPQLMYDKLVDGRVMNIGSGAAYFAIKGWAAYCVSKAALSMLTKCWQLESDTVSFTSVMPGIIDTDMQTMARKGTNMDEEQTNFYKNLKFSNRLLSCDTVAEFLTWLLLEVDKETYISKEWDIYDTKHHKFWLRAPHKVIHWEE
jgi:NAD(P)-dependent dehydrogenase (short-subunit alcohol dehydrogenase family)